MQKNYRLILLLAIAKFALPYVLQNPVYEPHRDEFLYLAEGRHLAWGYLEVPPLLSVLAWINSGLGNSIFWIKFWPNLFGTLTFVVCARMATKLQAGRFAIWLIFFAFIFSGWLRMFFLFQPNAPEIFFCALMSYAVFRFIQTEKRQWLYIFGVALGFGLLSKYTVAFWAISILLGLILTRVRKQFWQNKHFYFSLILAFFIFLPNLLWQAVHNFPVFHHMQELKRTQLQYVSAGDFFSGEFLMYLPVFFVWIAGLVYCFSFKGRTYRVFGGAFLCMQVLMLVMSGKSYYTAGSFPVMFVFGAVLLERISARAAAFVRYAFVVFPVVTGVFLWPVLLPVFKPPILANFYQMTGVAKTGALNWEDHKTHALPQDFADMLGWKELAQKTAAVWHRLPDSEKKNAMIWCGNYGEAGALHFYGPELNIPDAHSDNGSFIFWNKLDRFPDHIILIADDPDILESPELKQFERVNVVNTIDNKFAVEHGTRIILLQNPSAAFREFFMERARQKRDQFRSKILE